MCGCVAVWARACVVVGVCAGVGVGVVCGRVGAFFF